MLSETEWLASVGLRTGCGSRALIGTGGGPYVSERQWGTVREDYSADGNAWDYLPHDQARSRAYRWGEDGLAGFCDIEQRLCLGLALWNGRDPILKERAFGLTGPQGNHGEDVKEYWWYLDAIPSHAWNRWRYHYPQCRVPLPGPDRYQRRAATGTSRSTSCWTPARSTMTGTGSPRCTTPRPVPDDLLMAIQVTNAGPDAETIHVLPTAWFRNTWSWGDTGEARPGLRASGDRSVIIDHPFRAPWSSSPRLAPTAPARSCCSARTRRTWPGCTVPNRSRPIPRTASTTT